MAKRTTAHSPMYDKYAKRYARGGCTKEQLAQIVKLGALTPDEYKEITGEDYVEPEG